MKRSLKMFRFALAIAAAGAAGFFAGRSIWPASTQAPQSSTAASKISSSPSAASGPVIYYRDPDGRPAYSLTPKKTPGGKDYLPVHASEDISFEDKPPSAPAASGGPRRVRFYRAPMSPDTSATPKKDPMGMDYIPVYENEEDEGATVKISPGKLQRTNVRSEPAERRVLSAPVRAPGVIQFDERRISIVALRFEGFIESVENVATGDYVRKGQPLMRIYGPSLSSAAAEYLAVLNAPSDGAISAQRVKGARRRLDNLGMPESAIAAIERTRNVPPSVAWPAPADGHILERAAVNGMRAAPGDMLFRIVDHSVVWALADIAERDLALIAVGQTVSIRPRAYPDRPFAGQITLIYPHLNAETRTVRARIELPNDDGLLRADMYADVEIAAGEEAPALTVPDSAVIDSGARQVVLIDKGEGRFEPREVKLGRRGDGRVEIREGVLEGDKVVVSANFLIDAESNLKAALHSLDGGGKAQ
ncbi:MAG: efflux RND transporter periplasmic adaptor subunit [Methylocystis sp.]|nr:efflux RND transporter periplasmic adaptor subunit [Methylocystis sp.]